MFGREFARYPEILINSFKEMNENYESRVRKRKISALNILLNLYIFTFGIPEIGFQVRSIYFSKLIKDYIKYNQEGYVLDAGSGIGAQSIWFAKNYPNSFVHGWEIDDGKMRLSRKLSRELNLTNIEFFKADITKNQVVKNKYLLIINIDVLEHIDDFKKTLKNFYSLLTPKGYLFIHVPQLNQKRFFSQLKNWHHEEHVREGFDQKQLKNDLKKIGFKILIFRQTFGTIGSIAWELNHLMLSKNFLVAGLSYPFLYFLARLDYLINNKHGLGVIIIAQK